MQPSAGLLFVLGLSVCLTVNAGPHVRRDAVSLQDGNDAISLNSKFKTLSPLSPCETGEVACVGDHHAQCVEGRFVVTPCPTGLVCRASPNTGSSGTTINCMTENEHTMLILPKRAVGPDDPSQTSLTLNPAVISTGYESDGQDNITSPGQVASATSSNNWINFCMTVDKPLTNGSQITGGSCNPTPIGVIPSVDNMPSAKFIFPPNFAAITRNETFTVRIAINNFQTGSFTSPDHTYMSSPTRTNADGNVIGHSHIVIEHLTGFGQTTPTDPKSVVFYKGLNELAVNGVLSTDVTGGLPVGYYRIATLLMGSNHQPIALPVARRGVSDDMVYFSVL